MKQKNFSIYLVLILVLCFGAWRLFKPNSSVAPSKQFTTGTERENATGSPTIEQNKKSVEIKAAASSTFTEINNPLIDLAKIVATGTAEKILWKVAFTTQAPLAEWSDLRQQDGCEETSALMVVRWAKGLGALTKAEAKKEILAIAAFEEKNYKNYVDTSAADTLKIIIKEYFDYQNAFLKADSDIEQIKNELKNGNILILPADGKKLKNPNFKSGGPERHNLVIRGYDPTTKEFITNDPGTRKGEGYRYPEKIIATAWRDYPTGNHLPIVEVEKNMIVVMPEITGN